MAASLRLVRQGRRHRPFYRVRVSDGRTTTTGRFIEEVGWVDPIAKDPTKQMSLDRERIEYWLGKGVQVSPSMSRILKQQGIGQKAKAAPAKG